MILEADLPEGAILTKNDEHREHRTRLGRAAANKKSTKAEPRRFQRELFVGLGLLGLFWALPLWGAANDCLSCHDVSHGLKNSRGQNITVTVGGLQQSVHKNLQCLDCHAGAARLPHSAATASASCVACHADVSPQLASSAHSALGDPQDSQTCITCHGDHEVKDPSTLVPRLCSECHSQEVAQLKASVHGPVQGGSNQDRPTCTNCHGAAHGVLASDNPASPVNKIHLPETCGACHSNPALMRKYLMDVAKPVAAYEEGVHGRAIQQGNLKAASCNDCHGVHDILPPANPRSHIWKQNVAATCGKCHGSVYDIYKDSIHGRAVAAGVLDAPTCNDCHGEHKILAPGDPSSPVYMANVSQLTCSRCHADTGLTSRFNLPAARVPTYEDSYHGLASRSGLQTVANCASCHGVHNIYPSSDPRSTVNKANLGKTCGKCHPDAGQRFAIGPVHRIPSGSPTGRIVEAIKLFYFILIPALVGLMVLHNAMDWWRKSKRYLAKYRLESGELRMTLSERWQHGLLLVSFIVLVVTGFALKFPHSFWAAPIVQWEKDFPLRGLLHRIAGTVLIVTGLYHIVYLMVTKSGRNWFRAMVPKSEDAREAAQAFSGTEKAIAAHPGRFTYIEKVEYWGLVWGTVVMAFTGVFLWAHDWVLAHLPKPLMALDIFTTIHYYEAILATLTIALWHFYWVIFDPDVYPVKWTFLTGRALPPEKSKGEANPPSGGPELKKDPASTKPLPPDKNQPDPPGHSTQNSKR